VLLRTPRSAERILRKDPRDGGGDAGRESVIRFSHVGDEYGEFSSFAPTPVTMQGKRWATAEHYFQAMKFLDPEYQEQIRSTKSPALAARMGRSRKVALRRDWRNFRVEVMERVVRAKFSQHDHLRELLLSTGDARLVEHTEHDSFWGDGGDGSGTNMLGRILMRVRDALRSSI